jgi:RES domain-containing protein
VEYPRLLLEQLGALPANAWSGRVYRWTFEGTPPERPNSRGARWNPPGIEALYTALTRAGVLAESDYLIGAQAIPPDRKRQVHTFDLSLKSVLDISDPVVLNRVGVDRVSLASPDQSNCQRVGGAVERLGHDGLIVPSARYSANNLVIFVNRLPFGMPLRPIATEVAPFK